MDKRYQVFVSSTFADLQEERSLIIQTLMEMDCIPAGMEHFPAIDEEQFNFIKKIIDDCDYYILVIGGRYGSISDDGISFTEKEYDYAVNKGIKVLAFIHKNTDAIPVSKSELSHETREKLDVFRSKVSSNRLVKFWENPKELAGLVSLSLAKTIKTYPAVGWVRANTVGNIEILAELNQVRKENVELKDQLLSIQKDVVSGLMELASLDEKFNLIVEFSKSFVDSSPLEYECTWKEIFYYISPLLMHPVTESRIKSYLADEIVKKTQRKGTLAKIREEDFQTIKIQFIALELVTAKSHPVAGGGTAIFWTLTEQGKSTMMEVRTIKRELPAP